MLFAYLAFGVMFGVGAASLTLVNGGTLLMALAAYSAGGALAILAIIAFTMLTMRQDPEPEAEMIEPLAA